METICDQWVETTSRSMLTGFKPHIEINSQLYMNMKQELGKELRNRIVGIFGSQCLHTYSQISQSYCERYKVLMDWDLMRKLFSKCSAQNNTRKRPAEGKVFWQFPKVGKSNDHKNLQHIKAICRDRKKNRQLEADGELVYELPDHLKPALNEEMEQIKNLMQSEPSVPRGGNRGDKVVLDALMGKGADNFLHLLSQHVTKRLLNIGTNLVVRLFGKPKLPSKTLISEYLTARYNLITVTKPTSGSAGKFKSQNQMYVANLGSYLSYDTLLANGPFELAGCIVTPKPFQIAGGKKKKKFSKESNWVMQTISDIRKSGTEAAQAAASSSWPNQNPDYLQNDAGPSMSNHVIPHPQIFHHEVALQPGLMVGAVGHPDMGAGPSGNLFIPWPTFY